MIVLKVICSLLALYGAFIIVFLWQAYKQGIFQNYSTVTTALKIISTLIKAIFLLLCAWSAWQHPLLSPWFAWGAFAAFVIGGAADEIFHHGFISGFKRLIPTYYIGVSIHAFIAISIWLIVLKLSLGEANG